MKKINLFLLLLSVSVVALFTSCEETDPVGPTLSFFGGTFIDEDATVDAGETVSFSWQATKGDANLAEFTIRIGALDVAGFPKDDIDKDEYEDTFDTVFTAEGVYEFTFIAEDKDGEQAIETITITVTVPLIDEGTFEMGASGNPTLGSYYSVTLGVMLSAAAQDNADEVDIIFNTDGTNAKLTSPSNSAVQVIADANRLTTFEIVTLDFDAASSADLDGVDPSMEEVTITQGDVVVFETADDVKGILEVTAVTVTTDGAATIEVKIKE
jgi:plastocyanin